MASIASLAARRQRAIERFNTAREVLAERFSLELPSVAPTAKDPDLRRIEEFEMTAALLEALVEQKAQQKPGAAKATNKKKENPDD